MEKNHHLVETILTLSPVLLGMHPHPAGAEGAYDGLAPYYDAFTSGHDYEGWTATLEALAETHGVPGRSLLDCACGTGKSFLPFLRRGWSVSACDISAAMLGRARAKCRGAAVTLLEADLRALPELDEHDLVTCLDDGLNYLLATDELDAAIAGMARCTRAGGLVLFDLNTTYAYRRHFLSSSALEVDDLLFVWQGRPGRFASGATAAADVDVFERSAGAWRRTTTRHTQRHHPRRAIRSAARRAGLEVAAVHGLTRDGRLHDALSERHHTKAVYVLRKPIPERR